MDIQEAAEHLLEGGLVVFPTETVYGLGALAKNDQAVEKIFAAKGRPQHNPLILHVANRRQVDDLVKNIPQSAQLLMDRFWPGPLTICFQKSDHVSDLVTAGLSTVCIRQPDHQMAHELLASLGKPIAAPSANLSGKPSTTSFLDAKRQLEQHGVFFLDGGQTPLGLESTVVDCSGAKLRLLRPGVISKNEIEKIIGEAIAIEQEEENITSPGQLLRHYSPQGKLQVLFGKKVDRRQWISKHIKDHEMVFGLVGNSDDFSQTQHQVLCDREDDLDTYAHHLYGFLNWCDQIGAKSIILELPRVEHPLLAALKNRLEKASQGRITELG